MKLLENILREGLMDVDNDFGMNPLAGYPLIGPLEISLPKPEINNTPPNGKTVTYEITDIFGSVSQRSDQFDKFQKEFATRRQKMLTNTWCCNQDNFQKIIRCKDFRKDEMAYGVDVMQFSGGMVDYLSFVHLNEMQLFKGRTSYAYYYAIKWYPIQNEEIQEYLNKLWKEKYERFV